jgi:hypothetical protein
MNFVKFNENGRETETEIEFFFLLFLSIDYTNDKRVVANSLCYHLSVSYSLINNSDDKEKGALFVTTFQILD